MLAAVERKRRAAAADRIDVRIVIDHRIATALAAPPNPRVDCENQPPCLEHEPAQARMVDEQRTALRLLAHLVHTELLDGAAHERLERLLGFMPLTSGSNSLAFQPRPFSAVRTSSSRIRSAGVTAGAAAFCVAAAAGTTTPATAFAATCRSIASSTIRFKSTAPISLANHPSDSRLAPVEHPANERADRSVWNHEQQPGHEHREREQRGASLPEQLAADAGDQLADEAARAGEGVEERAEQQQDADEETFAGGVHGDHGQVPFLVWRRRATHRTAVITA